MQDLIAISVQGELYALERRTLAEYNDNNTLFTYRAEVLRFDEDLQSRQPITTCDIAAGSMRSLTTHQLPPILPL